MVYCNGVESCDGDNITVVHLSSAMTVYCHWENKPSDRYQINGPAATNTEASAVRLSKKNEKHDYKRENLRREYLLKDNLIYDHTYLTLN